MSEDRRERVRDLRTEAERVRELIAEARDDIDATAERIRELEAKKERRERRRRQLAGDAPESRNGKVESDGEPAVSRVSFYLTQDGYMGR